VAEPSGYARPMRGHQDDEAAIRAYVENQAGDDVVHVEHAASEMVGPVRHEMTDLMIGDCWLVAARGR
jgi:hypothetical protein